MSKCNVRREKLRLWLKCFFREWVTRLFIMGGRNPTPNKVKNREMNDLMITLLHKIRGIGSIHPNGYDVVICLDDYAMKVWAENRPYADVMVVFYERKSLTRNAGLVYVTSSFQFNGVVREKLREVIYPIYRVGVHGRESFRESGFEVINPNKVNPELIKRMIASYELSLL